MKLQKLISLVTWCFIVLAAVALSFKSLSEPDLWWQLLTGDWILTHLQIPRQDIFSFTHSGVEWINVKWLFEMIQALFYRMGGAELLYLMQTIVNLLILFFAWRICKTKATSEASLLPAFIVSMLLVFVAINFRIIGRPEMISHLFSVIFLYLVLNYRNKASNAIFFLIPLQALWTNLHEAYGLGIVLNLITLGIGIVKPLVIDKSQKFDRKLVLATSLAIVAVSLNPRGFYMLLHPLEIFGQVGQNKFTTELFSVSTSYYKQQFEPYVAFLVLLLSAYALPSVKSRSYLKSLESQFGLAYWVSFVALAYLALTAHRNIPFFILWSIPALFYSLNKLFSYWKSNLTKSLVAMSLSVVFYALIVSNQFYRLTDSGFEYGLGISEQNNPIGAANFIRENKLNGPCFSDYLVSSYLMWELRPDFKSFIDFRDLDIFPASFFEAFNQLAIYPEGFEKFHSKYNFGYAVLNLLEFPALHLQILNTKQFEIVYADHVSVVYVNTEQNQGFDSLNPIHERAGLFNTYGKAPMSTLAAVLNRLVAPFVSTKGESPKQSYAAALFFQSIGRYDLAVKKIEREININSSDISLQNALAKSYFLWAAIQDNEASKRKLLKLAFDTYNITLQLEKNNSEALIGIARVQMQIGKAYDAMANLNRVLKVSESAEAYSLMAQCQNLLMQVDRQKSAFYTTKWYEYMHKAHDLNPDDPILNYNLGVSYCQIADCQNAKAFLERAINSPELSLEEMKTLASCKKQCGVSEN